ncbi:hypothetical protein [Dehalococcoides mccartyi]|uniref:hypothetical protein n=1 Tax=Dehalococcoides mccartyi TaxID=61435 RepID=UPI002FCA9186
MAGTLKQEAKRLLSNVPEEYVFWGHDGCVLHNLKELGDAMNIMADETYDFHANAEKNDFANWVRDIIKDKRLSQDLQKATGRDQAAQIVASRISTLDKSFIPSLKLDSAQP